MSSRYLKNKKPFSKYAVLSLQQRLLEAHFPFLTYAIKNNVLIAIGWIHPDDCKEKYKIKIECVAGHEPKSTILYPVITPGIKIHMYDDHSLCLHYPPDMKWNERTRIYQYTVPWICEWIILYELFQINGGIWEGKESPVHFTEADKNVHQDID